MTWQMFDDNDYFERLATHTAHLFNIGWVAGYPDPDDFLRVALHWHHGWHNEQYEQLLESARRIDDPVERLKFYQAADRLLTQEAGIMPLGHSQMPLLVKPWVKRYPVSALRAEYWKDVIIEPHPLKANPLAQPEPEPLPSLPARREVAKQKYGGLTAKEREVAALAAQGKSNREIAAELFVGLKTVEAHISSSLSKLGFTSRAQIAAWAVAKGLAEAPADLDTLTREG
jgi:DNA-binding CsgD family transcriptional regulator